MNSERLKKIMQENGITRPELAKISGVSRRTIEGWFDTKHKNFNPTLREISKVATALGVSIDAIVEGTALSESESFYAKYSRHKALLAQIDKLDKKSAELINEIIEIFYKHNKM